MKLIPEIIECRLCGLVHAAKNCQINNEEISPVQQVQMEFEKLQSFSKTRLFIFPHSVNNISQIYRPLCKVPKLNHFILLIIFTL